MSNSETGHDATPLSSIANETSSADRIPPAVTAAHQKEPGLMKNFGAQVGATKIMFGALTATALAGGILTVNTLTASESAAKRERIPQNAARLSTIENIYAISDDDVGRLQVVTETGIDIRGQLLLASGQPASGLQLNIKFPGNSQAHRRHVTTDAGGYFHLQGLPEGRAVLFASTPDLQERVTEEIMVPVAGDMTLRMTSMACIDTGGAVTLFGMKLIDVTAELKKHYDLHFADGVLVLQPGPRIKSLFPGLEDAHGPQVGDQFFVVADKRITNVEEFARELLLAVDAAIIARMADDTADASQAVDVRVAYIFQKFREAGTNTWHMRLTPEDVAELRAFVEQLHDD